MIENKQDIKEVTDITVRMTTALIGLMPNPKAAIDNINDILKYSFKIAQRIKQKEYEITQEFLYEKAKKQHDKQKKS